MLSNVKEYSKSGLAIVTTNPKYYLFASIIELIVVYLVLFKWQPLGISENYPPLAIIMMVVFVFIQLMMYFFVKNKSDLKQDGVEVKPTFIQTIIKIVMTLGTLFGAILFVYGTIYIASHIPSLADIYVWLIDGLIIITLLAVVYLMFMPMINAAKDKNKRGSVLKLIGQVIMYLPCALIDLMDWVKYQYNITTKPVWMLLGIEFLLIGLRILLPMALTWFLKRDGNHLMQGPTYIDKLTTINHDDIMEEDKRIYTYSISSWFWINPQPPNTGRAYTRDANILNYGEQPSVSFNSLDRILRITCKLSEKNVAEIYETNNVKYQAWNNLVVNYDRGTMDVFLNGELVASRPDIAPLMSFENMEIGEENGIAGAVCNVVYYDKILYPTQIEMAYRAQRMMETPTL